MYNRAYQKIFISSKVVDPIQRELNLDILEICSRLGFDEYLPQIAVPLDAPVIPIQTIRTNEKAVDRSDILLMVFDQAGGGGAMEYQRAHIFQKQVVGYRSPSSVANEDLGMMLEGAWSRIPSNFKSSSTRELEQILSKLSIKGGI
jgi:nucleoside 2-deoxyribosyltransferase